jgi:hypothetical protein
MARHMNLRRVLAFGMGVLFVDIILFGWFACVDFSDIEPTSGVRLLGFVVRVISWPAMLLDFVLPKSMVEIAVALGLILTVLFWGILFEMLIQRFTRKRPKSPEPTPVSAGSAASRTTL